MTIVFPIKKRQKVDKIINLKSNQKMKIREFAEIIGFLVSCCTAVEYGFLYTKASGRAKYLALEANKQNYETKMTITDTIVDELNLSAFCNGERANGHWTNEESCYFINYLELLAAFFGLKIFAKNHRNCSKRQKIDKIVNLKSNQKIKIREFAEIIGFLVSCCTAVEYGFLYTKASERAKYLVLEVNKQNYETKMTITDTIVDETDAGTKLPWWPESCPTSAKFKRSSRASNTDISRIINRFFDFCIKNKLNPFDKSIKDILLFLTSIYDTGAAHSSLNCYRSAIALLVRPEIGEDERMKRFFKGLTKIRPSKPKYESTIQISLASLTDSSIYNTGAAHSSLNCYHSAIALLVGPEIGEDERMKRFFKSLTKIRPSKPKYESTWDPKIVLDHFSKSPKNEDLSLKLLSTKLISLLALITGHRLQTISLIKIDNIVTKNDLIEIKIPDRIKTSGPNKNHPQPLYKII
ncbi:hypothetical protein TSAR_009850 [Trichomalopsis sarcophagae]|uniref:Tyr recombinase domain-containing protein n=1 Tax=Trichomalopsis sarcophagae TaxID=543379 RepID=A0A232ERQ5_9HYME|nr:hypothetical protein TSAR_009850 [Trichomalopsis sarcophagae]